MAESKIMNQQVQQQALSISKVEQKLEHNHEIVLEKIDGLKSYFSQQMTIQQQQMNLKQEEREEKRRQQQSENRKMWIINLFSTIGIFVAITVSGVKMFYHLHEDVISANHQSHESLLLSKQCMTQSDECLKATLNWKNK